MKNTKERILETALMLFNKFGLHKVTLRTIAKEMGISQGNLNYHFKKREDIIESLYFNLVKSIDEKFSIEVQTNNQLQSFFETSKSIGELFFENRFFLLDFVQIIRDHDKISTHYKQLTLLREQQFLVAIEHLISMGLIRKELLPNEYKNLYKRLQILSDFWISSAMVTTNNLTKKTVADYSKIINQGIFPYLTDTGISEFEKLKKT